MAIRDSKDRCAYPDLIFYYAAPSANPLYANPRKAGGGNRRPGGTAVQPVQSKALRLLLKLDNKYIVSN